MAATKGNCLKMPNSFPRNFCLHSMTKACIPIKLTTCVKACEAGNLEQVVNGKKNKIAVFEIELNDTILFPEGGGQPDDRGTINGIEVLAVKRRGNVAIHYTAVPIGPGTEVHVVVDWNRRWDHMQQHSGQHLITALASSEFGFETTSWNLGEKVSTIELDTNDVTSEQMSKLERLVNDKILSGAKMFPTLFDSKDDPDIKTVRTRGLPDDHVGAVRIVTIEGIETNMCCGTHVSTLAHLQSIKLLAVEKGKKGRVNLVFVAGERVLKYLSTCYEREKVFTQLLKGGPDDHIDLLQKLQNSFRVAQKNALVLLRESAKFEAERFKALDVRPTLLILHKKEGDNDFMNLVVNEIGDSNVLIFITSGDDVGQGLFLLNGPEQHVDILGPKVAEVLDGKGAGKKGRFQGKANKIQKRTDVEKMLRDYFANQQN